MILRINIYCTLFYVAVATLWMSCAKEGTDGEATLVVKLRHHSSWVASSTTFPDSVFVKFNVKEIPVDPTHDYDALFVGVAGEDHITCEGLKWGYYSVFCSGWDTTMNLRVSGGTTYKVAFGDRKQELALSVPVVQ